MKNFLIALAALCLFSVPAFAQFDIYGTCTTATLSAPAAVPASITNAAVDVHGYVGQPMAVLSCSPYYDFNCGTNAITIQESDNSSTLFTNISGASFSVFTNGVSTLGIIPGAQKKYLRVVQTITGTNIFHTSIVLVGRLKYN